tara:strand:- start:15350 stop:15943 length:594 start_codon:yes stop_codon:yes gene_type:complete
MEPSEGGEEVRRRGDALSEIRTRVASLVGGWLKDEECVQLVLACGMRAWEELVPYLFARKVLVSVKQEGVDRIAVTPEEWDLMFGTAASPTKVLVPELTKMMQDETMKTSLADISSTLRCTLHEPAQETAWTKPWVQTIVFAGIHMREDEQFVNVALGNLVRADSRRLEDLRSRTDELDVKTMLLSQAITVLATTVT